MRLCALILAATLSAAASAQSSFTLQQVLSAPYASELTAAPTGALFAWVEDAEGRHNLYIGGPNTPTRALTHNTVDDAQDISNIAWSPDGSAIAYTYGAATGADGKPANPAHLQHPTPVQVIVQPLAPDAKAIVIGEGHGPLFTRDGRDLLLIRDGKIWMAASQLPSATPPCAKSATICDLPVIDRRFQGAYQVVFDRGSATSLTLSPDGNTLAYISHRREANEPSHSFLALFDIPSRTLTFPAPATSDDSAPAFSPDGQHLAWLRSPFVQSPEFASDRTSATPWSIQLLELRTRISRTLFAPEPNKPGSVLPHMATGAPYLMWTAGRQLVFFSEEDGWVHLYAVDPASQRPPVLLTAGNFEVEDPIVSKDGHLLAWSSNRATIDTLDSDRRHIWQLNVTYPGEAPKYQTSGSGIEIHPAFAADGSTLAVLASDTEHPTFPALVDAKGGVTQLRVNAIPKSYPAALITPTQVIIPSTDDLTLHAQLFLRGRDADSSAALRNDKLKGGGDKASGGGANAVVTKHPAILFLHGGPRRQMLLGYPSGEYYSNAYAMNQYLASLGFIVLSVNYRCGIGYGLDFRQCLHAGADGAAEYADVLAAQKYLASRADVDAKRIGVWGGSYGGYLTALALARNSDLFAAGVDFHGVHDWNLEDNASDWKQGTFAQQDAIAAKALASSPLGDISHWRSPVLLIHGDNDPEVAYAETPILAEALRARNAALPKDQRVEVEDLIFPDEVHGFLLHQDWLAAYGAAAAFFERTLKPTIH